MNFGKEGTKRRIRDLTSPAPKARTKMSVLVGKILLFCGILLAFTGASAAFGAYRGILENSPDIRDIDLSPTGIQSVIYDSTGKEMQILVMAGSNRDPIRYESIPKDVINAFIAIEDARFWQHNGIDLKGIVRAAFSTITDGELGQGASTITQQLIKNNVFSGGSEASTIARIQRKIQEQYLALQAEQIWDKKDILEDYLNTINLGANCLGIQTAAERYFGKPASELTLSEGTVLAAITSSPTRYNPITHPDDNLRRRRIVLDYMVEQGYIDEFQKQECLEDNVYERIAEVNDRIRSQDNSVYSYFVDSVINQVYDDLQNKVGYSATEATKLLYSGGLRIYTTQDPALQAIVDEEITNEANYSVVEYGFTYQLSIAKPDGTVNNYSEGHVRRFLQEQTGQPVKLIFGTEEEIHIHVDNFKNSILEEGDTILGENLYVTLQPQVSFVLMDQATGYVRAISGGRGEKLTSLSLNRATDSPRQPGSCFKPIVSFGPALDTCGAALSTVFFDTSYTVGPKTFSNWWSAGYTGFSNIRQGLTYSMNIVAVRCLQELVTARLGFQYALNFGFSTLVDSRILADGTELTDIGPALALGGITNGVTNLELTAAYAAIADGGVYHEPIFYTRIVDNTGKTILDNTAFQKTRTVIKDTTAFLLTNALEDAMEFHQYFTLPIYSTATAAHLDNMACAAKTGTTTDNNDLWLVGYTPYYTAGIWEGYDVNFFISESTSTIRTIWKNIMTRVHEGLPYATFPMPSGITAASICAKCGNLAVAGLCEKDPRPGMVYTEYFAPGTIPTQLCTCHEIVRVCTETGGIANVKCPKTEERVFMKSYAEFDPSIYDQYFTAPGLCEIHDALWTPPTTEAPTTEAPSSVAPTVAPTAAATAAPEVDEDVPPSTQPEANQGE